MSWRGNHKSNFNQKKKSGPFSGDHEQKKIKNHYSDNRGPDQNRSVFNSMINGKSPISNENDSLRFFKLAIAFSSSLDLLNAFDDPSYDGKKTLQHAISCGCESITTINSGIIPFISFLGRDDCSHGSAKRCRDECYRAIFRTPGFLGTVLSFMKKDDISDVISFAWFLASVARLDSFARENPYLNELASILKTSPCPATAALATALYPIHLEDALTAQLHDGQETKNESQIVKKSKSQSISANIHASEIVSLDQVLAMQPQHDNDFPFDYRKIVIVPTSEEINKGSSACIPTTWTIKSNVESIVSEGFLLDRHFRLLREDLIAPAREELIKEINLPRGAQRRIFENPGVIGVLLEDSKSSPCILVRVDCTPALRSRVSQLKSKQEKARFFSENGRRILGRDSMVFFTSRTGEVKYVGVVTYRDESRMIESFPHSLTIGINFLGDSAVDVLLKLQRSHGDREFFQISPLLFQASMSLFSYTPILTRLQDMVSITFSDQIVYMKPPCEIVDPLYTVDLPPDLLTKLQSDDSQLQAVQMALKYNVSLIQGPPGTGKTFVGVLIAKALLSCTSAVPPRILCLCYTNHALDNFLESLIDEGVKSSDIVRLGSSPKISERLKSRCLKELSELSFDRFQNRRYAILKQQQEECRELIREQRSYVEFKEWGPKWWFRVKDWMEINDPSAFDELNVTIPRGMNLVNKNGNVSNGDELWIKWLRGVINSNTSSDSIWSLTKTQRNDRLKKWQTEWRRERLSYLVKSMNRYTKISEDILALRDEAKVPAIRQAKVIGCTTTSAAKHIQMLSSAEPTVVIIEEAGEILESHVLTTMSPSLQRLIMIGDHLQLRAKLEHYPLRKESGKHIDFDESLFERLILHGGFPSAQLNVQHRMRPEISELVRKTTYPSLADHPSVFNRSHIRGLVKDVIFITHSHLESADEENAFIGSSSKTNLHEIKMVVAIAKYLIQQGYNASDLVILTPYLGQLAAIQSLLTQSNFVADVGDLDKGDLVRASLQLDVNENEKGNKNTQSTINPSKSSIRVATIDNYQGEEAKIVIASLVRSNHVGDIGFVSGPERVNVLFSRARDGFIMIGNDDCLRNCRNVKGKVLWNGILDKLASAGAIFEGLPVQCQRHETGFYHY